MLSIAIIVISIILGDQRTSAAAGIGYMGGFILAMILNTDGVGPGGGRTNNAWII